MAELIYSERKPIEVTLYELTLRAIANLALDNALIRLNSETLTAKSGFASKVTVGDT